MNIFKKVFNKSKRELKRLRPLVAEINGEYEALREVGDDELRGKTDEFKRRLKDGETLDDLMVEAFAVVKETCRRFTERRMTWDVVGNETTWQMIPFDVQLIGAVVLHQGKLTEMATGEGKTLVAVMPLYLNALEGQGAHLVTVNDFLAKRDASWNGPIYHWLGLSVAVLQDPNANNGIESFKVHWTEENGYHLVPVNRKEAYACDIVYGRQDQFGFDYLYDNMAWDINDVRHKGFHYAIVDEADQLLIDEARTPLIISDQVADSKSDRYTHLKPIVERLVKEQTRLVAQLVDDGQRLWEDGRTYAGGRKLLQAQRGAPKQRQLMRLREDAEVQKQIVRVELDYMRDKRTPELDEELLYVIEERHHAAEITDEGRSRLLMSDEKHKLISLRERIQRTERDKKLTDEEKQEQIEAEFHTYIEDLKEQSVSSDAGEVVRAIEANSYLPDERKAVLIERTFGDLVERATKKLIPASLTDEIEAITALPDLNEEQKQTRIWEFYRHHAIEALQRSAYFGAREIAEAIGETEHLTPETKRSFTDQLNRQSAEATERGLVEPTLEVVVAQTEAAGELTDEQKRTLVREVFQTFMDVEAKNIVLSDIGAAFREVERTELFSPNQKADIIEELYRNYTEEAKRKFILPDLSENLETIEKSEALPDESKKILSEKQYASYAEVAERIHGMSNLIRSYGLFERDVNYVVQDGKVVIVDEFTGRLQPGRRFSDGLHQALEAKENVTVERDTQTVATITVQNYFRMYDKLAGMTGTAETEEDEFFGIYKLEVIVIPTNKPVRRLDLDDVILRTRREKYNAVVDEVERLHNEHLPVLIGTRSVAVSETLSRMLQRKAIAHSVLNAKYHEQESAIIANAGQPDSVTIATNMAGRGTDIKIHRSLIKCEECKLFNGLPEDTPTADGMTIKGCLELQPCGLHIVGTERHDARRIDRQLRGRSGRQGDPGASQFFISLEDDLMRLFGSERVSKVMTRLGAEEGEAIQAPMVTKAIDRAQQRVEANNFDIRKRLLDYDDVMNQQREVIYDRRRYALENDDLTAEILTLMDDTITAMVPRFFTLEGEEEETGWDFDGLKMSVSALFGASVDLSFDGAREIDEETVIERVREAVNAKYEARCSELRREARRQGAAEENENVFVHQLQKFAILRAVDERWRTHLTDIDDLKGGIHLRAYGQKDPVVEFKREAYDMFERLIEEVDRQTLEIVFKSPLPSERDIESRRREAARLTAQHSEFEGMEGGDGDEPVQVQVEPQIRTVGGRGARKPVAAPKGARRTRPAAGGQQQQPSVPKVSRNAPCPCGSGKKYKYCHGKNER